MNNIFEFYRAEKSRYNNDTVPQFGSKDYNQVDLLQKLNAYQRNQYYNAGEAQDDVIGPYPFDNIIFWRALLEARSTDFDTANIVKDPLNETREARVSAMVSTKALAKHMRDIKFFFSLNKISWTRCWYGGVLTRKESDGTVRVVDWERVICDQQDIINNPIFENYIYNPAQLMEVGKEAGWDNLEQAIFAAQDRLQSSVENEQEDADYIGQNVLVQEMNGVIPVSMLKEAKGEKYDFEDENEYVYARIITAEAEAVDKDGENSGAILFAEELEEPTYKFLSRNPIVGRGLGLGLPEQLFEPQKWHNFTKTEEMRMLAVAGKQLYVTNDPNVTANIFEEGIDHGTILKVGDGKEFRQLNQFPSSLPQMAQIRSEIDESATRQSSSFSAVVGEESKANVPFRAQYLQNQAGSGQFKQYRQEIGEFVREIVEDWVLPDALIKAAKNDRVYETFSPQELQLIDEVVLNRDFNKAIAKRLLEGSRAITPEQQEETMLSVQQNLQKQGNKRAIVGIKEFIRNADTQVVVHTTDEAKNRVGYFESLSNTLALFAPDDPRRNAVIDRIMDSIGITADELALYGNNEVAGAPNPQLETEQLQKQANPQAVTI